MAQINLQEIHDLLVSIALEAGNIQHSANPSTVSTKKNTADLVTETDRAIETLVSTKLKKAYPSFQFIGEETYVPGQKLTDEPTFICDPIDGTTNFVHGYPAFCISLGLAVGKIPVVGVIYNPSTRELYTGMKGNGSFLTIIEDEKHSGHGLETHLDRSSRAQANKRWLPLRPGNESLGGLDNCLVGIEWGSERSGPNYDLKCEVFKKLGASKEDGGAMVHSMRSLGSAALNLAYVAAGRQDVYWEGGPWAWDVCAGWCILNEARGLMVGGNPGEWKIGVEHRSFLAVTGAVWDNKHIAKEFWGCMGDGRLVYED